MITRIRKNMDNKDQGFTLIELLVVMIIIGILAAVAIPLFLSQRKKAEDAAAKADVSTLGKEIATWYVDGTGTVPTVIVSASVYYLGTVSSATRLGNQSNNVVLGTQSATSASDWCIGVKNAEGDKAVVGYSYSAEAGLQNAPCS